MAKFRVGPPGRTVAVIGPDGAGKSTLIDRLQGELPCRSKRIYMGINPNASTHALPTTRLIWFLKRRLNRSHGSKQTEDEYPAPQLVRPVRFHTRLLREMKSTFFVINRVSEQWYRQSVCWYYQWRGNLVLIDRHFYLDYMAVKLSRPVERSVLAWRVHDFLIERIFPRPDLTLYLDAPPEVMFARKPEVSLGRLASMRQAYRQICNHVRAFEAIDATMPAEMVLETARQKIIAMLE